VNGLLSSGSRACRTARLIPEEFVAVFHELGFQKVDRTRPNSDTREMGDERWEQRVMCVEFDLSCEKPGTLGGKAKAVDVLSHPGSQ
jgi:hypothetical protein